MFNQSRAPVSPPSGPDLLRNIEALLDSRAQAKAALRPLNTSMRELSAEHTLARIKPLLKQFNVEQIVDLTLTGVPSCPVFQVVRSDCRSHYFNAGKGFTVAESLVSGLMEAIEVRCFERADPALLAGPSHESGKIKGWDHSNGGVIWLDAGDVFHEDVTGQLSGASPNGIASGNSIDEALCHALGEMLERHALAGFYQHGAVGNSIFYQQLERVSPSSESEHIQRCLRELKAKNINAEFIMISADAGVSVFICFLDLPFGTDRRAAVQGYGAHPDPKIAMSRALGEAVQILALCPVDEDMADHAAMATERVVMTSKQSAALDRGCIAHQRLADHALLQGLRGRLELTGYEYLSTLEDAQDAPPPPARRRYRPCLTGWSAWASGQ